MKLIDCFIISMVVMFYSVILYIVGYDLQRRAELSNGPVDIEYEHQQYIGYEHQQYRAIAISV